MHAIDRDGTLEVLPPGQDIKIGDTTHPRQILDVWTESQLANIGIYPVTNETGDSASTHDNLSEVLNLESGVVKRKFTGTENPDKVKAVRISAVENEEADLIEAALGDTRSRLAKVTQGLLLLDVYGTGSDNGDIQGLRAIGVWWQAVQVHAATLRSQIQAGQNPDIKNGWPTL